ncbi:AAA family ATPase [Streptosporangium sp. NPDC048047]|uniref:helix-turn-helix transcriptional regulator n=1 Tax=Streptosporangium sp. NPDC048047 TaxID=3155748 RepID=UPI003439AB12
MRGREPERAEVLRLLEGVAGPGTHVLLVEGEPGIGKSLLLAEAAAAAAARGTDVAAGRADELERMMPLAPLLSALEETTTRAAVARSAFPGEPGLLMWLAERVRTTLERRAAAGPLLLALDDLQWADPVTLMALRTLPARLAGRPLAWLLARRATGDDDGARLFGLLEQEGAARIALRPLDGVSAARVAADALGAAPDAELTALAAQAAGNPALLLALLTGLREEGAVLVDAGVARPAGTAESGGMTGSGRTAGTEGTGRPGGPAGSVGAAGAAGAAGATGCGPAAGVLPRRLHAAVRRRLDEVSPRTRHLLEAVAVLGRSFCPSYAAELLGESPAALLPALDEALAAGLLVATPEELAFRHELLWRSVLETVPPPVRQALRRQAERLAAPAAPVTALLAWDEGRLSRGLELAREAAEAPPGTPGPRDPQPRTVLAAMLIDLGLLDEAEKITRTAAAEAADRPAWAAAVLVLRARLDLAAGRPGEAAERAETALAAAAGLDVPDLACLALSALGTAALRAGDLPRAARALASGRATRTPGTPYGRLRAELAAGRIIEARDGAEAAMAPLGGLYDGLAGHTGVLTDEPAAAAWLVRTALTAGDGRRADAVAAAAEDLAGRNPCLPGPPVAAVHARGLRDRDPAALGRAAAGYADPWARASAAEDLGVLLGAAPGDRDAAVATLNGALSGYDDVCARRDAARVRRRLRELGERRRHWERVDHPDSGWSSLTATERAVCDLVSQGLTNRQAAEQMFVSEHTVAFHLRQIFRKLGVRSRVELARLAALAAAGPDGR